MEVECRSEEIYVDGGSGEDLDDGEDVREGAMSRAVVVMSLLTETWRCSRDLAEAEILREDVEARMSMAVVVMMLLTNDLEMRRRSREGGDLEVSMAICGAGLISS